MENLNQSSHTSTAFFVIILGSTLAITYWASRRTRDKKTFFTADGSITPFQNGLALAGDYLSAASFLGIAGMVALSGFDGLLYSMAALVGWPLMLFLIAENIRRLGQYTFADVVAFRFKQAPIRVATAISTMVTVILYMIVQMVGGGHLIKVLFGIDYEWSVTLVGTMMLVYVMFGGMLATTWIQIVKAVLMIGGATGLAILVLAQFQFNPPELFNAAARTYGVAVLAPGKLIPNPWDAVSLGLGYALGVAALPHVLMRFYTVPSAADARLSVAYATGWIGYFYLLTFVIGFGAMTLVGVDAVLGVDKAGNMAAPLLAWALGGPMYFGFISAVAFATILAVVAGLTLSGAAAVAHDVWAGVLRKSTVTPSEQMLVAKITVVMLALISIALSIAFKSQNVGFMAGLAIAVAAAANFPALVLSMYWRRFTTLGAVTSIFVGVFSSLLLIYLSPTIQIDLLHNEIAYSPLRNPGLVAIPLAFASGIIASLWKKEPAAEQAFDKTQARDLPTHAGATAGGLSVLK